MGGALGVPTRCGWGLRNCARGLLLDGSMAGSRARPQVARCCWRNWSSRAIQEQAESLARS